jgi:hypothetical protein
VKDVLELLQGALVCCGGFLVSVANNVTIFVK